MREVISRTWNHLSRITDAIQHRRTTEEVFEESFSPFIDFLHDLMEDRSAILASFFTCEQFISGWEIIGSHPEYLSVAQVVLHPDFELITEKALKASKQLDPTITAQDLVMFTTVYTAKRLPFIALCSLSSVSSIFH